MARVVAHACFTRLFMPAPAGDKLIDDEGLMTAEDLSVLTTERVRDIVASIRKPGGTIPNPAGGGHIQNPGIYIPERASHALQVACFLCLMKERCQRPFTLAHIQVNDEFLAAGRQRDMEAKHSNSDVLLAPLTNKDINGRNFLEFTEETVKKLSKFRHSTGILIGHVLRNDLIPMASADDPTTNYITHDDEAFARVRIINAAFEAEPAEELEEDKGRKWCQIALECNGLVYDHLRSMLSNTKWWNHVSNAAQRRRDGRGVLVAIRTNICGPSANTDLQRKNRAIAENSYYDGEKRGRNWETYVNGLRRCFKVQEALAKAEPRKFHVYSEEEKVDFLRGGCKTPNTETAISTVMATKELSTNFEKAQQHVGRMIDHNADSKKLPAARGSRNISETNTNSKPWELPNGKFDHEGCRAGKYDAHLGGFQAKAGGYSPEEWRTLHPMVKRKRYLATHNKDGSRKGGRRSGGGGGGAKAGTKGYDKRKIAELETKIEEMEAMLNEHGSSVDENECATDGNDGGGKRRSNSGNPALEAHGGTHNKFKRSNSK